MKTYLPLLSLCLLAGCSGSQDTSNTADPAPVASVRLAQATLGSSNDSVTAYGATEAGPGADHAVVAPAEAVLARISAPTGTAVTAGQPIATLTPSPATRSAIAKAGSDTAVATAAFARAQRLRRDGLVSDADVETARAAATTARATQANLGITGVGVTLRAATTGTVQNLTAKIGDQVAAGATIASIIGRGDLRARLGVDPSVAQRIPPGETISVQMINGGGTVSVPVVGVDPQVDPTTRLASVFVRIPASAGLSAGQPVKATLNVGGTTNGLSVPYAALLDDGGKTYVFVVKGGVAHRVDVVAGNSSGNTIQILKGLNAGDRVVVQGGTALDDGMKVAVSGQMTGAAK